jgi:tetratricopeptide (TPR) repeat protein
VARRLLVALPILLALDAAPARADSLWDQATLAPETQLAAETYQRELAAGDEFVDRAQREETLVEVKRLIGLARQSYANAVAARPDEPEAHDRLAMTLYSCYLSCPSPTGLCNSEPAQFDRRITEVVLTHWQRFAELAPDDPRALSVRFTRAILHTKMAEGDHLARAAAVYEQILDEPDLSSRDVETILSNLAETYMMNGDLEAAIAKYREAADRGGKISSIYGWAVALDRDGRGAEARALIAAQGMPGFDLFRRSWASGESFFVPAGERFYYFALAEESLGMKADAIASYDLFIRSGAHPRYQARARHNLGALMAKGRAAASPRRR